MKSGKRKFSIYTRISDILKIEIYRVFINCYGSVCYSYTTWKIFNLSDLHRPSRYEKGLPVPYGTSILLKFENASELERYLIEIYLQKNSVFYQVQFGNIQISEEASINILKTYTKSFKSSNKIERHKHQKNCVS